MLRLQTVLHVGTDNSEDKRSRVYKSTYDLNSGSAGGKQSSSFSISHMILSILKLNTITYNLVLDFV